MRDLESIRNIQSLSLFLDLLRTRVGGMVILSNLGGDIQVSPKTIKAWLEVLERMYLVFTVKPYTKSLPRAIQKPPKVYFFDNGDVLGDEGARFENLVATSLLKRLHFLEDRDGFRCELRYIRDKEGREVDFAIIKEGVLEELVEVKYSDDTPSKHLAYYAQRLKPKQALFACPLSLSLPHLIFRTFRSNTLLAKNVPRTCGFLNNGLIATKNVSH